MKFYLDTSLRAFYDSKGELLASGEPQIPYKSRQMIEIQLVTNSPDNGTPGVRPEIDWPKDKSFDIPGVTALLSVDNDFKRRNKGTLKNDISAGTVTSITGAFSGVAASSFRIPGTLRIFDAAGNAENLSYTSLEVTGSNVVFAVENSSVSKSYSSGATIDAPDSLYMQAALNAEKSSPATGLFIFDLVADSAKLREAIDYSSVSVLSSIAGMELLVFTVEQDNTILERNSFVCETVSVTGTIGDPDSTVTVPDLTENALAAAVSALNAQGFIVEYSTDKNEWHSTQGNEDRFLRFRFKSASASEDAWVVFEMKQGPAGKDGTDGTNGTDGKDGASAGFGTPVLNVTTGVPGTQASGTVNASGPDTAKVFAFDLTIPQGRQGDQGPKGDPMKIDATGTVSELSQYDGEPKGFSFLATDTGQVYIKNSDASGDWSDPVGYQGPPGKDGEDGYTPVRGTDYWTEDDIATIKGYVDDAILNGAW